MEAPPDALAAPFLNPVAPGVPAGEDLSYSEEYLRVRAEMDKLGSVSSEVDHEAVVSGEGRAVSSGVDFEAVVELAQRLLRERTKDVQLASYLTYALTRARGLAGLTEGLVVTHGLAATFWDDLHPQKPVRRRNALQFLADRAKEWVSAQRFGAADVEALAAARGAVVALQALATEKMGEGAPALSGLRQTLDDAHALATRSAAKAAAAASAAEAVPAQAAAPEPEPTAPAPPPEPAPPRPTTTAAPSTGTGEVRSAGDARQAVLRAAAFLRERDAASPAPYRLTRAFAWGGLLASPPNQGGKTLIPPVDAATRAGLAGTNGDPRARLLRAEEASAAAPLWLDPQRVAVEAAGAAGLGPVREAILDDLRALLRRCPDLPTLTFSDGTPLADEATRAWLADVGGAAEAAPAAVPVSVGAVPAGTADGEDAVAAAVEQAEAAAAAGDFAGAVAALQRGEADDRTARDRFRRRLHLAALCLRGEQPAVARLLLDPLAADVERHALDAWEPALAVEVWALLYAACAASVSGPPTPEKQEARERAAHAFARLCRLDPARGLAAQPRR